jgi:hypothetical protein
MSMKKEQYFVHYRDDGPQDAATTKAQPAEAWSCLFVFDDFSEVVAWQEQEFHQLTRQRANARIENRWSTKYNESEAHAVYFVESVRQELIKRVRPPRAFRLATRPKRRFAMS